MTTPDEQAPSAALRLGILGGGQLGRMLALAAEPLGCAVTFVDPSPDSVAKSVATQIVAEYTDPRALSELSEAGVVTFEFENVPDDAARALSAQCVVHPHPEALRVAQDRLLEKTTFRELDIDTNKFLPVQTLEAARFAFENLGPMVLKTRRLGYDGKGQAVVRTEADLETAFSSLGGVPALAEELVPFEREISAIVCRGQDGDLRTYAVTENRHARGILRTSIAPAPELDPALAHRALVFAARIAEKFDYVGVLALELFVVGKKLVANEFAPRVHNSGHWTIEGAETSQFENHVRAVLGLPLGSAESLGHAVMHNLLGEIPDRARLLGIPGAHLHDYKKEPRGGRKVGHVTVVAPTPELARERAARIDEVIGTAERA